MAKVIFGKPIKWEDADFNWDQAPPDQNRLEIGPYTWDNVLLIIEAVGGGGDMDEMPWTQWGDEEEKKKRLIKLILKVKGKTYREEKEIQDYKITVKDIKLVAKEVAGIELTTENISF